MRQLIIYQEGQRKRRREGERGRGEEGERGREGERVDIWKGSSRVACLGGDESPPLRVHRDRAIPRMHAYSIVK